VGVLPGECDLGGPVLGGDGRWVIPLEVTRLSVVEVGSFPEFAAGVKSSFVVFEFIGEDQLEF